MVKRTISQIIKQIICIVMVAIVIAPIVLTFFASLKTKTDMINTSPLSLPSFDRITFENYKEVLTNKQLLTGFKNTGIILAVSLVFNVLFGTITAFIIERFQFRGKKVIVGLFFLGMLIPTFVTEIARFQVIQKLNLYNTLGAPIIIYIASDLMQLYIYRQFISGISVALDEAALLDGCSYFGLFTRIIFPLLAPATATVCIIKAISIINDSTIKSFLCLFSFVIVTSYYFRVLPSVRPFRFLRTCSCYSLYWIPNFALASFHLAFSSLNVASKSNPCVSI